MEKNINKIKLSAKKKEDENFEFRLYLKMSDIDDDELDKIVKGICHKVTAEINCKECNNCCKVSSPSINEDELKNISKFLNMSKMDFINKYINTDMSDETDFEVKSPCPFFSNNICNIEEIKPQMCREYPYLMKEDFRSRLLTFISNYKICPIVYNVYEDLKNKFNWK